MTFDTDISDSYSYGHYTSVWPEIEDNNTNIDVLYYVYGVETAMDHTCF